MQWDNFHPLEHWIDCILSVLGSLFFNIHNYKYFKLNTSQIKKTGYNFVTKFIFHGDIAAT